MSEDVNDRCLEDAKSYLFEFSHSPPLSLFDRILYSTGYVLGALISFAIVAALVNMVPYVGIIIFYFFCFMFLLLTLLISSALFELDRSFIATLLDGYVNNKYSLYLLMVGAIVFAISNPQSPLAGRFNSNQYTEMEWIAFFALHAGNAVTLDMITQLGFYSRIEDRNDAILSMLIAIYRIGIVVAVVDLWICKFIDMRNKWTFVGTALECRKNLIEREHFRPALNSVIKGEVIFYSTPRKVDLLSRDPEQI